MSTNPETERLKNRAYDLLEPIETAFERGEIDEAEWHRRVAAFVVPAYLSADNPRSQSGFSRDEEAWEYSRGIVMEAIDRDGTFLDIGLASGHLMECIETWGAERDLRIEAYGLDIVPAFVERARSRLPHLKDRMYVGNAQDWLPPFHFDYVRTGLEYVPRPRRAAFVGRLLKDLVRPGGRLIIGAYGEEKDAAPTEDALRDWGFAIAGRSSRPHPDKPHDIRALWIVRT